MSDEEDPDAFCFCTGIERGVKAAEWVFDSGATMHMTFSVRDITDKGNRMLFDDVTCSIISKDNSVIASGHKRWNLLDGTADRRPDEALVATKPTSDFWHQRLAQVNDKVLQKLVSCDVAGVDLKKVEPLTFCEGCVQGKATKHKPKPLGEIHSSRRLEKVHSVRSTWSLLWLTFLDPVQRILWPTRATLW